VSGGQTDHQLLGSAYVSGGQNDHQLLGSAYVSGGGTFTKSLFN